MTADLSVLAAFDRMAAPLHALERSMQRVQVAARLGRQAVRKFARAFPDRYLAIYGTAKQQREWMRQQRGSKPHSRKRWAALGGRRKTTLHR